MKKHQKKRVFWDTPTSKACIYGTKKFAKTYSRLLDVKVTRSKTTVIDEAVKTAEAVVIRGNKCSC